MASPFSLGGQSLRACIGTSPGHAQRQSNGPRCPFGGTGEGLWTATCPDVFGALMEWRSMMVEPEFRLVVMALPRWW